MISSNEEAISKINRGTYLALKIAVLLDFCEVDAQFVLDCILDLFYSILHQKELLEFCVGPRSARSQFGLCSTALLARLLVLVLNAHHSRDSVS